MAVITWKNVGSGGSSSGAGAATNLFEVAKGNTDAAFDNFNKVLSNKQRTDQDNWDTTKDNNTAAFKDMLAGAKSVEELAALEASGQLDASQYGSQIDRNVVRDGADQRKDYLRDAFIKQEEFNDVERIAKDAPFLDSIKAHISGADFNNPEVLAQSQTMIADAVANGMSEKTALELNDYLTGNQRGDKRDLQGDQSHSSTLATQALNRASASQRMQQDNIRFDRDTKDYNENQETKERRKLLDDRTNAFGSMLGEARLKGDMSAGDFEKVLLGERTRYIKEYGATGAEADAAIARLKDVYKNTSTLTEDSLSEIGGAIEPNLRMLDVAAQQVKDRQENHKKNNTLYNTPIADSGKTMTGMIDEVNKMDGTEGSWTDKEFTRLLTKGTELFNKGIDVRNGNKTENFVVTEGMMMTALRTLDNAGWFKGGAGGEDKALEKILVDMVTAEGHAERFKQANSVDETTAASLTAIEQARKELIKSQTKRYVEDNIKR